ncbi:MAG: outer membrane lipoprotein-sorting protein [Bacillota bacterium]
MKKKIKIISICLIALFIVGSLNMTAAAIDGREVMERVDERDTGDSRHALMGMDLIDEDGNVRPRVVEVWSKKFDRENDLDQTIMLFHEPASVKNTRFLQIENDVEDDDQWIYLPDLGRVRRISGGQGEDSFMGTDFTYDDMKSREIDDFVYELLKEEEFNGYDCYVVEAVPKNPEEEQYAKTISWVTKDHYVPLKVKMYNKNTKELFKEMIVESDIEKVSGIWTVYSTLMKNLDTGHSTRLYVKTQNGNHLLEYNKDISDKRFTQQYLKTGR